MEQTNVECLDQKSPVNHSFKGFSPVDVLLRGFTPLNPIFGLEFSKETIS